MVTRCVDHWLPRQLIVTRVDKLWDGYCRVARWIKLGVFDCTPVPHKIFYEPPYNPSDEEKRRMKITAKPYAPPF